MKKLEQIEIILSVLSLLKKASKFENFIPTAPIQKFYVAVFEVWKNNDQKIDRNEVFKKMKVETIKKVDYASDQLIDLFYAFCYWELELKTNLKWEIRAQIMGYYVKNKLLQNSLDINELNIVVLGKLVRQLKAPKTSTDYYYSAWGHQKLYFSSKFPTKKEKEASTALMMADVQLDIFYSIHKLRITLEKISRFYSLGEAFPMINFQLPIINEHKNLTLELYERLYLVVQYTRSSGRDSDICTKLLADLYAVIQSNKIEIEHKDREFMVIFLINYLAVERGTNWREYIYNLYKMAFDSNWLIQVDGAIRFEDFANAIASCLNFRDPDFLNRIKENSYQYALEKEQYYIANLCEMAHLYLQKKWLKLFEYEKVENKKPELNLRAYYATQVHVLKTKAIFENFINQNFQDNLKIKGKNIEIELILQAYKAHIRGKLIQEVSTEKANLKFIKELGACYKILISTNWKKEKKIALSKWKDDLDEEILYYNWLIQLYNDAFNKLK
ncbi:hypothetical protein [Aureispira anguillae]|uniref:Uncharacterized protein n=1 Tax=Aureispira anguillae TaxID=2864201 RepID=A0A916DTG8_9BACT|nr:hypothetical protein [Aureispira anguillae]BDS11845.1 hypothetical protein AsAng_0025590 [Aureispira anguillae]